MVVSPSASLSVSTRRPLTPAPEVPTLTWFIASLGLVASHGAQRPTQLTAPCSKQLGSNDSAHINVLAT